MCQTASVCGSQRFIYPAHCAGRHQYALLHELHCVKFSVPGGTSMRNTLIWDCVCGRWR